MKKGHDPIPEPRAALKAIAEALNLPIEAFASEVPSRPSCETAAMLALWSAITDPQGRRRVLNLMHREAERSRGHGA